jgi:hypothetical protein
MVIRMVLSVLIGAGVGFGAHRLVGCRSGSCPIWASPYFSSICGGILGLLLGIAGR